METTDERVYTVQGMTCGHCRAAVIEEVEHVAGVARVEVELETGRVTVHGEHVSDEAVAQAVGEAGYHVAGSR